MTRRGGDVSHHRKNSPVPAGEGEAVDACVCSC